MSKEKKISEMENKKEQFVSTGKRGISSNRTDQGGTGKKSIRGICQYQHQH